VRSTRFRINARVFRRMAAAGDFGDKKVELLNGRIEMMTTGPAHDYVVSKLHDMLADRLDRAAWTIREEKPLQLGWFWRPAPDIAVVRGPLATYRKRTPGRLDTALLIEVADTTYAKDAGKKLRHYLRCGIAAYWIVDLGRRLVEVRDMRTPGGPVLATYPEGASVPFLVDGREYDALPVSEILA
jgi:Uma2 family endonuclease